MVEKTDLVDEILQKFPYLSTYFYTFELGHNLEYGRFLHGGTIEDCYGDLSEDLIRLLNYYISRKQE